MVLFLHNRYRTTGGEERVVSELLSLVREQMGEPAELLERESSGLGRGRAAAALLHGGLSAEQVGRTVRDSGARVVHAHNLLPSFGWRALAAAREAGARVVLHLHQYRLVCATGVCFTQGAECTRCHAQNTLPGVRLNCRGSLPEAVAYGLSLALSQRRLIEHSNAFIVPSRFARERLRELGAPLPWERVHVIPPPVPVAVAAGERATGDDAPPGGAPGAGSYTEGSYALVVSRLAPEKGVDVAVDACRIAGMPLVVAGDGPELARLRERAGGAEVRFAGRLDDAALSRLRAGAAIALAPSRSGETFGLAVAEAMAAGLPVLASAVGALGELLDGDALVAPGDAQALAAAIGRLAGDRGAGERGRERIRALCSPATVAASLASVYDGREPASAST